MKMAGTGATFPRTPEATSLPVTSFSKGFAYFFQFFIIIFLDSFISTPALFLCRINSASF
jgi:hypothetical protein